jgi:hypothetical protein
MTTQAKDRAVSVHLDMSARPAIEGLAQTGILCGMLLDEVRTLR